MSIRKVVRRGLLVFCLLGCAGATAAWTLQLSQPWKRAEYDLGSGAVPRTVNLYPYSAEWTGTIRYLTCHYRPGTSVTIALQSFVHVPPFGRDARKADNTRVRVDARVDVDTYLPLREWTLSQFGITFGTPGPISGPAPSEWPLEWVRMEHRLNRSLTSAERARLRVTREFVFEVGAPTWAWLLVFAAYPTYVFLVGPVRRRYRRQRGLCKTCGYDLRGTEGDRCTECGSIIARRGELRRHSLASDAVLVPRPVRPDDAP